MKPKCISCGFPLSQYRMFNQECKSCGSKYVARPGFSWVRGLFGVLAPAIWLACLFLPLSMSLKLVGIPLLLGLIGMWITLGSQRWVARKSSG